MHGLTDNKMKKYVYRPSLFSLSQLELIRTIGGVGLCPKCKSEIVIVASSNDAQTQKKPIGVHCSNNEKHIAPLCVNLSSSEIQFRNFTVKCGDEEFLFSAFCKEGMAVGAFISWRKSGVSIELYRFQIKEIFASDYEELVSELSDYIIEKFGIIAEVNEMKEP